MLKYIAALLAASALAACYSPPVTGNIVVAYFEPEGSLVSYGARIKVEEYRQALPGASPFRGYYHDYIVAGIEAGVTLQDVRQGRFILAECDVGPGYTKTIPVLLPPNPKRSGYVELEYTDTNPNKPRLATFRRYIERPWPERVRAGYQFCNPNRTSVWWD
jgi:hypothetical protein